MTTEQDYLHRLYRKLDELRAETSRRLADTLKLTGGTPQARTERDISTGMYTGKLAQLSAVENGLCFGRLDLDQGEHFHIGRIGLFDEEHEYEPLLIDWRAPAARPFYLATAASREGVWRRRHIRTRGRTITGLEDEVLDLDSDQQSSDLGLAGEATLLASLDARRTPHMRDIVATIQAEQDQVIRAPMNRLLVVQGGPGTGKTAVALHRAAYLLYTFRDQLTKRGVLVVGPNTTFLRYIGQVLPSLGETGVLLSTVGELYPGVKAQGEESPQTAEVKGRLSMVEVLTNTVRDWQQVPKEFLEVAFDDQTVRVDRKACQQARTRARRSRKVHNEARRIFQKEMFAALTLRVADQLGRDLLDQRDLDDIRRELREDPAVLAAVDALWPELSPTGVLSALWRSPEQLRRVSRKQLTDEERSQLLRSTDTPQGTGLGGDSAESAADELWTEADIPLLDELAELLGEDQVAVEAERHRREREELAYAQGVLHIMEQDEELFDPERLRVADVLDAELLAERYRSRSDLTAAERAAEDRTWTFGHIIVDEAQELSPMTWRVLMRRCPSRSMTLVGDIAQTSALAGTTSWSEVLEPYVAQRWQLAELTVNYRTPSEIMALAEPVLGEMSRMNGQTLGNSPSSVRSSGYPPWTLSPQIQPELPQNSQQDRNSEAESLADLLVELPRLIHAERETLAEREGQPGRVAVILPKRLLRTCQTRLQESFPDIGDAEAEVVALSVSQAKGLEFDSVLLVEPAEMLTDSPRGLGDLYVALTRATQRLGILHTGELPDVLAKVSTPVG